MTLLIISLTRMVTAATELLPIEDATIHLTRDFIQAVIVF